MFEEKGEPKRVRGFVVQREVPLRPMVRSGKPCYAAQQSTLHTHHGQ